MERLPLPTVLVTLDTICIVDVTGIKDPELLQQALFGTLWEYDYRQGYSDTVIFSDPDLSMHMELHPNKGLSSEELFSLCENCGCFLKLFARPPTVMVLPAIYIESPHWYQAPDVVATVFSRYEKRFACDVNLAGAETVGMIMDRIVKELQCHHYYLPIGGTCPTSEHQSTTCQDHGPAAAFYGHFREDIRPNGSVKLFVNAYQARAAKRIIKHQPGINDLNIAGQVLPYIVVTIVARRNLVCTVVLTGIDDPPIIRQRIIEALRFYEYFIRSDLVITQTDCSVDMTYSSLTDNGLFSLCREQGDTHGSLKLFVEASTLVYASEYERSPRNPLPKIVISVLDWDNQQFYFNMNMQGLYFYNFYDSLCNKVEARTNMKLVSIYGAPRSQPDTYFSSESYHLFDLIQEKAASKDSLKLFIILQEHPSRPSPSPPYVPSPKTRTLAWLDRLKSRRTPH